MALRSIVVVSLAALLCAPSVQAEPPPSSAHLYVRGTKDLSAVLEVARHDLETFEALGAATEGPQSRLGPGRQEFLVGVGADPGIPAEQQHGPAAVEIVGQGTRSSGSQVASGLESRCTAKWMSSSVWFEYMTPTRSPPNETIEAMSSSVTSEP